MRKDSQLTFRIPSDLKKQLEAIASSEGRSVAQVCEAFLRAGTQTFGKRGTSFLQRFLSRQAKESVE
jgi:hypothetical protein